MNARPKYHKGRREDPPSLRRITHAFTHWALPDGTACHASITVAHPCAAKTDALRRFVNQFQPDLA